VIYDSTRHTQTHSIKSVNYGSTRETKNKNRNCKCCCFVYLFFSLLVQGSWNRRFTREQRLGKWICVPLVLVLCPWLI